MKGFSTTKIFFNSPQRFCIFFSSGVSCPPPTQFPCPLGTYSFCRFAYKLYEHNCYNQNLQTVVIMSILKLKFDLQHFLVSKQYFFAFYIQIKIDQPKSVPGYNFGYGEQSNVKNIIQRIQSIPLFYQSSSYTI